METKTLNLRVLEISEAKAGRFARVRVKGIDGPGRMRFFDIPAEDFQVGDQLEFSLVRVNRNLAIQAEQAAPLEEDNQIRLSAEAIAVAGEFDSKEPSTFIPQPLTREELTGCTGCSFCRPEESGVAEAIWIEGDVLKTKQHSSEEIESCFGHDIIHRTPEGA